MVPQDPSFWWKAKFYTWQGLRALGNVFKDVSGRVVVVVETPYRIIRRVDNPNSGEVQN
jgi:hypothetical protein